MKVALLNPPGSRNYLRDYYCTTVAKTRYYYHPVDLLYLSGTLAQEHAVAVLDAVARRLSPEHCLERLRALAPDAVVSLVSAPSYEEDHAFLAALRAALPKAKIVGTGDVYREFREELFGRQPYLDASLVDFSTPDLLAYLRGPSGAPIENMIYRHGGVLVAGPETHGKGAFRIPLPLFDEFPPGLYRMPFMRQSPFATVLTDFGCPYLCTFCPVSTLGFKLRPVDDVMEELSELARRGYREIHFRDQTFGVDKKRTLELCARIAREHPRLTWSCFSRVDVLDEERARAMARAGCHTVIFGIEFDEELLQKAMKKNISGAQALKAVALCQENGIRVAGTFIVGLPDQDAESFRRTGELAARLGLDFASFNLAMPRMGTPWRRELLAQGKVDAAHWQADTQSGTSAWKDARLSQEEAHRLLLEIERSFYLRPEHLTRLLGGVKSWTDLTSLLSSGAGILAKA